MFTDRNISSITGIGSLLFCVFVTVTDLTYSCIYGYSSCKDVRNKINVSEYMTVFLTVFENVSHLSNHDF